MPTILWILIIFAILFIVAQASRKIFKTDIFLGLFIMTKTRRFIPFLDKLAKPKKTLNVLADIGIVLGFGSFGLDYVLKDKLTQNYKRVLLFIISSVIFTYIYYIFLHMMFSNNPIISTSFIYFMAFLSGIMGLSGFTLASLVFSAYDIIVKLFAGTASTACPGVGLVIPGVKMPKVDLLIPWYGWIILIISAIIHEFAHGTMLRTIKAKVKSMGFILAGVLPLGAFVEPDDKQLAKKKNRSVIRMLSAGPTSNAILAIVFLIIYLLIVPGISDYSRSIAIERESYLYVHQVDENISVCGTVFESPAYGVLEKGDLILSVNDRPIRNRYDLMGATKLDFENKFVVKNQETDEEREVYLTPNEMGRMGFTYNVGYDPSYVIPQKYYWYKHILAIILWTAVLNFLIATVNFLPTFPFDGGMMSKIIFEGYLPKKKRDEKKRMKMIARFFGTLIVILLLLNIIPYFF
jgi:membrane-associated protease RseP (regulator of RpoE activity)